ncbi:MAG TPA: phosphotransferase [Acidimicrobiia bacterium]
MSHGIAAVAASGARGLPDNTEGAGSLPGALPTSGLEWACRLLWGGHPEVVVARRKRRLPAGFRPTEAYLVLPKAANPRLLVPLGAPRAAAAALARNHDATSRRSRLVKAALSMGVRLRVAQRLLPDRVEIALADGLPAAERGAVLLSEHLRDIFGRRDLEMAVILGPARLNRKPVLQVLSSQGEVLGYVKAAWNDLTRSLVRNEAAVLGRLDGPPRNTFVAPRLLHHGPFGDLELLAASPLPNAVRPEQSQVFDPPLPVITEIARLGDVHAAPLAASDYWRGVNERLEAREALLPPQADDPLKAVVANIQARHGATELRFGTWHGDFTPWNMARLEDGIFVWDWERSGPAPVGLDLLHFLFQSTCRFEGRNPARSVEICRERTPGLLPLLDVPMGSENALWSVYRMELLFRYEEAGLAGVLERRSRIHQGILEMFESEMEAS